MGLVIRFELRPHQEALRRSLRRFNVVVWHRRAGKTHFVVARLLTAAARCELVDGRFFYIGPTYRQAKGISWDLLKRFAAALPGATINEQELRVDLANGARVQLLGAEQYNSLRGRYADGVVIDETALIPRPAWSQVILPLLADRRGWAILIGTPLGRMNLFHELYAYALEAEDPDWHHSLLTWRDTGALRLEEVERLRRLMRPEEFAQELECSWSAAIRGAYYAPLIEAAEAAGRITTIARERGLPVTVAMDLGWSDLMVATVWQVAGTEHRCLNCEAYERSAIPDVLEAWKGWNYKPDLVVLPHDARVTDLGTGKTRQEVFEAHGLATAIAPNLKLHEGIEQTKTVLEHTWFNRASTQTLREALVTYRSEFDEVRNVHRVTPVHDWSSHYADSVRYYAVGRRDVGAWADNSALYQELGRGMV